jgi:glutamate 5-kinase
MTKFDIELVGKVGSMALVNKEYGDLNYNIIARLSRELRPGFIWVTSGAMEIGRLDYVKRNGREIENEDESDTKVDYAAQGQSILMNCYREYVDSKYSLRQVLVEHQHFNDEIKCEHLKKMFLRCPSQNAIPIVNYNDAVSDEEVRKLEISNLSQKRKHIVQLVDNDETASQIACLVKSKTLLILSSVDGIFETPVSDGVCEAGAEQSLVKEICGANIDELIKNIDYYQTFCNGASRKGAGGAKAKLEYIKEPLKNGTTVIIANSKYKINDILQGRAPRTKICVR